MTDLLKPLAVLALLASGVSGCTLAAGTAAGYIAADEIDEGDGKLDVLEDVRGVSNGYN